MYNLISLVALLLMGVGAIGLYYTNSLFSYAPMIIALQALAVALMIWARITFGFRSFHAAADPTEGELVTNGPYRFVRHPIYTAICLFVFAGALSHISLTAALLTLLTFSGALVRMFSEEYVLTRQYSGYRDYAVKVKRMIPFVF